LGRQHQQAFFRFGSRRNGTNERRVYTGALLALSENRDMPVSAKRCVVGFFVWWSRLILSFLLVEAWHEKRR
jgi:hypothetical protein